MLLINQVMEVSRLMTCFQRIKLTRDPPDVLGAQEIRLLM